MANFVQCSTHGETEETFVCSHLAEASVGLGFNCNEPSDEKPFPDAWCDDCDLIFQAYGGWNDESEKLVQIRLLCSGCYEKCRIRNTRTEVTLDGLAELRWQCGSCEEWHYGPCLDFGYAAPFYWGDENDAKNRPDALKPPFKRLPKNFLDEDFCIVNDGYFIRGIINLPIIGTTETLRWGVWGSLKRENFQKLLTEIDGPKRVELPPMFSWLSNSIPDYPETLNLQMYAHIQELGERPTFELEPTDHPLSVEYYEGITPERVKEIMMRRLDMPEM